MRKNLRVLLRTRGSLNYGWGHVVRTLRVAQDFQNFGYDQIAIAVDGSTEALQYLRKAWSGTLLTPDPGDLNGRDDDWLRLYRPDIVSIDMIAVEIETQEVYASSAIPVLLWNDLATYVEFPDLVVCPQVLSHYPQSTDKTKWLTGSSFFPLPIELQSADVREHTGHVKRAMVVLGGSLPEHSSSWVGSFFQQKLPPEIEWVVPPGFEQATDLKRELDASSANLSYLSSPEAIYDEMKRVDFAISGSGYLKFEFAAAGVPTLLVATVDHQMRLGADFANEVKAGKFLGDIRHLSVSEVCAQVCSAMKDSAWLKEMSQNGQAAVRAGASQRILEAASYLLA